MNFFKFPLPIELINAGFLSAVIVLESIQLVLALMGLAGFIPMLNSLSANVFQEWRWTIHPQRQVLLYQIFVIGAVVVQAAGLNIFEKKLGDPQWGRELKYFFWVEAIFVFLMLSALFKTLIYFDRPFLAQWAYQALWVGAILNKIFWVKIRDFVSSVYALGKNNENCRFFHKFCFLLFPLIIVALIYMPDPEAVVARIFIGEQCHHFDVFVAAPAWAHAAGNILGVDQIADYGVGMPIMISELSKLLGGCNYMNIFLVIMWGCVIYYVLWFFLLKKWLRSLGVAVLAILVGIRVQMFHTGIFPFVFGLPSATVLRYPFDVLFFFCLFLSFRRSWMQWNPFLILAGIIAGVAVFYMTSTGMALVAALYFYLAVHFLLSFHFARAEWFNNLTTAQTRPISFSILQSILGLSKESLNKVELSKDFVHKDASARWAASLSVSPQRQITRGLIYFSAAPLTVFLICWFYWGQHLWTREVWENIQEFTKLFLAGTGYLPFLGSFKQHDYLANSIGVLIPLVHVLTVVLVVGLVFLRKISPEHLFAAVLAVYGLAINQYYVSTSAITTYYTTGLPFIFVLGYWINVFLGYLRREYRWKILIFFILISTYALVTNHNYCAYPNLLNVSRNPLIDRLVAQRLPDGVPYFNHLWSQYLETVKLPVNSLGQKFEDIRVEENFSSHEDLKAYFREEFDFTADALLIQKMTAADEKIALISNFDVKILMQANRRPFFYYFPMVISRPMRLRMFGVTAMYTTEALKRTIRQLDQGQPKYIFWERIYLSPKSDVPKFFYYQTPALLELIDYVKEHYEFYADGKFLVAMRRKIEFEANSDKKLGDDGKVLPR